MMAIVQNWDCTNRMPEKRDLLVLVIIKLIGRPAKLEMPFVKLYLSTRVRKLKPTNETFRDEP